MKNDIKYNDLVNNHEPIYLYNKNNVPYDEDGDCQPFVFLTPYLSPNPTGGAVIVIPGGGYNHLSNSTSSIKGYGQGVDNHGNQKEASSITKWFNESGISVFVLNYRTLAVEPNIDYHQLLSDGSRAIKYVRAKAKEYLIKDDKIAIMGYSAGGHLASMMCNHTWQIDSPKYIRDEIDEVSSKVNAGVLCYAVISARDDITHQGTRRNFTKGDQTLYDFFSADKAVNDKTPPTFLWHHKNDSVVNPMNSYLMAEALKAKGIDYECHIFDDKGTPAHGVGVAQDYEEAKVWPSLATNFLKRLGF